MPIGPIYTLQDLQELAAQNIEFRLSLLPLPGDPNPHIPGAVVFSDQFTEENRRLQTSIILAIQDSTRIEFVPTQDKGMVWVENDCFYWSMDYLNPTRTGPSEDLTSPSRTFREIRVGYMKEVHMASANRRADALGLPTGTQRNQFLCALFNDWFRAEVGIYESPWFSIPGLIQFAPTFPLDAIGLRDQVLTAIRSYTDFPADSERNQGTLKINEFLFNWKIEYEPARPETVEWNSVDLNSVQRVLSIH